MTPRRYPLATLLAATNLTRRQAMRELHLSGTTLARLERDGLTDTEADHHALRLGLFPWQVWPDWIPNGTGWDPDHPAVRAWPGGDGGAGPPRSGRVTPHVVHDEAS